MPRIHILPEPVACRIAAGEVVERPSSVVKELVENAIDAGAAAITVVLEEGGKRLIRVEDDGEGMDPDDAVLALERHATSKLSSDRDLESIATLGFRGEALPSIAAVSELRIVTARRGAAEGCEIEVRGGVRGIPRVVGAPAGTLVEVSDLFRDIPARRKFLKTATTELSHSVAIVSQHALAHPEIAFRIVHGGREILSAPRAGLRLERLSQIYGGEWIRDVVPIECADGSFCISGVVSRPHATRGTRSEQEWFVGSRPVRIPFLTRALCEGYGSLLAGGRHPFFVLFAEGSPGSMDVNVHPTKREVRFRDPQIWYLLVKRAVESLWRERTVLTAPEAHAGVRFADPLRVAAVAPAASPGLQLASAEAGVSDREYADRVGEAVARYAAMGESGMSARRATPRPWGPPRDPAGPIRILGQIRKTFIVAEIGDVLQIIDQHTAHERVLFDRLWERLERSGPVVQPLLFPVPVEVKRDQALLLEEYRDALERIGLEFDGLGGETLVVRAVPQIVSRVDIPALIAGIVEDLADDAPLAGMRERSQRLAATMACHAAVRANDLLEPKEMSALVEDLYRTPMPYSCPHGRPVILAFSHADLDRMFHRH